MFEDFWRRAPNTHVKAFDPEGFVRYLVGQIQGGGTMPMQFVRGRLNVDGHATRRTNLPDLLFEVIGTSDIGATAALKAAWESYAEDVGSTRTWDTVRKSLELEVITVGTVTREVL